MAKAGDGWKDAEGRAVRQRAFNRDRKANAPCWICGEAIDYRAKPSSTDLSYEPDHYLPRSRHPELALDLANIRAAHKRCNRSRKDRMAMDAIGNGSGSWRR